MANENLNEKTLLTEEGLNKLNAELRELIDEKRPTIIKAIQEAREQGDLSENADYAAAKNEQGEIEKRIQEIKDILSNYELISEVKDDTSNEKVKVGSKVKLLDLSNNEEVTYEIVGEVEADPDNNKISNQSPLAQAILGKNVKTIVEIRNIDDHYKVKILKIKN
ncbi:MAG: transcription elongation factor GreA [Mycoplasma sp.]|nr:transcription elongation factor GreA [Mycoplasma sp.]